MNLMKTVCWMTAKRADALLSTPEQNTGMDLWLKQWQSPVIWNKQNLLADFEELFIALLQSDSADFKSSTFIKWQEDFFGRLAAHVVRACNSIGCKCGKCGAPSIVAFCGKRQFLEVVNAGRPSRSKLKTAEIGPQIDLPSVRLL